MTTTPDAAARERIHRYFRISLISALLTAVAITVNHLFTLGPVAYAVGAALVVIPGPLFLWFRKTRSNIPIAIYLLLLAWIVVGFGLFGGYWNGLLRLFFGTLLASVSTDFAKPMVGSYAFEASGILTFVGALFVAYGGIGFLRAKLDFDRGRAPRAMSARRSMALAAAAGVAVLVSFGAYAHTARDSWTPPRDGTVRIGVIAPISGPYAMLGGSFVKAIELAKDELENTKYRYELVVRDIGRDPTKARAAIEATIFGDKVDAVLGGISLIGQVTQPYANKARIPHLCVCTVTTIGDGRYNFTNIPVPAAEAKLWVAEAKRRGIQKIAVLPQNYPSILNHVKAVKAEAARAGIEIVFEQEYGPETRDFAAMIAKARARAPDVYYIEAFPAPLDALGRQLAEAGIRNLASVVAPSVSEHPELFEGIWYTDSNLADPAFRRRFETKFPGIRFATHMMPYAYDNFRMIVHAFEIGRNPAVYLRGLTTYAGTAGTLSKARGTGNFLSTPAVWTIRNGRPELLHD